MLGKNKHQAALLASLRASSREHFSTPKQGGPLLGF